MGSVARGVGAVLLLIASNAFMNVAWYLHLKFKSWPLVKAIFLSWLIAFFEYCLQVPANRMGHFSSGGPFTAPQLKTIQEFLTLTTFAVFSIFILNEKLRWSDALAFALIFSGVVVGLVLAPKKASSADVALPPPPVVPMPETAPLGGTAGAAATGAPSSPAAAATAAASPAAELGSKPPPALAGRKLLQLLPCAWRRDAGQHADGSQAAVEVEPAQEVHAQEGQQQAGSAHQGPQHLGSLEQQQRQQEPRQQRRQQQQQQYSGSEDELLLRAPRDALQSEGSSAVLLASGAEPHISSSRQSTHQRELH